MCISKQSLGSEETRALVRAMESRVEVVRLEKNIDHLDITALTLCEGKGRCRHVSFRKSTLDRYRKELRSWAWRINWPVTRDGKNIVFNRSQEKNGSWSPELLL